MSDEYAYSEQNYRDAPIAAIELNPTPFDVPTNRQDLITQALTQIFKPLGVKFKFSIQRHPQAQELIVDRDLPSDSIFHPIEHRLWIICYSQKSLDYQLLAEPLAKQLRSLNLQGFQDAIIQFSTLGTHVTDQRLRLNLTHPAMMLKNWARWGDVQAITKLLNFALEPAQMQVSAILKNLTLHIFCTIDNSPSAKFPPKKTAIEMMAPLLLELAPQGIQGATIYGVKTQPDIAGTATESPVWTHWLDLPGLGNPQLSPTPLILAERGDQNALNFVLQRFLNPDLEQYCELGGISLSLLRRRRVLHVMSEAPICPLQSQVATTVIKILRQLALPDLQGVRVYGRISGQNSAQWTYGVDFDRLQLELPPVAVEQPFVANIAVPRVGVKQRIVQSLIATRIWQPQFIDAQQSQLVRQPRFQWQPSFLLLLVGCGLAIASDMSLKLALEHTNLDPNSASSLTESQLSFNNSLLEEKLAQYQMQCLQYGTPDVLIVGSSRALRGIDPQVLQRSLIDRGLPELKIYNFGINGATAQVVDLVLRQLLTPQQLPKLVIWADGARAFNSGRADRTYETIALSSRYRQLVLMSGGDRNFALLQAQTSVKNSYEAIDRAGNSGLDQISLAYHHRDQLKSWLQAQVPFVGQLADTSTAAITEPALSIQDRSINSDGFLPLELKFDPATYYQKYTKVTGASDGDYANFQLLGSQHQALQQVTNLLASRKIPLIFVNLPMSDLYLDNFRSQHEASFKQYLEEWAQLRQLTFVDMNGFLNKQYDRFSDPSHLNQFGASEVSRYLAQTTLIPWQMLLPRESIDK